MTLSYLAICLAAGILWADARHPKLAEVWMLSVLFVTCLGWAISIVRSLCAGARQARFRYPIGGAVALRFASFLIAGWLAFDAGFFVLDERIRSAAQDAARADINAGEGPRIAEAAVDSRRATAWGEEFELSAVQAVDAASPLPERLTLRLARSGASPPDAVRARDDLWPGTLIRLGLRVAPLHSARNPGAIDHERAAARRGLGARARLVDPRWVVVHEDRASSGWTASNRLGDARNSLAAWRADRRSAIGEGLARAGDRSGLARALALGDRRGLAPGIVDAFRRLGLSHLLAVSGLHVGMVGGLIGWLALRCLGRVAPALVNPFPWVIASAVGGAGGYAWLVGQTVSVERAWGCLFVAGVLALGRRRPRPLELLAGIAIVLWLSEPASLFALGAQLSFAACCGLIAAGVWRGSLQHEPSERGALAGRATWSARLRSATGLGLRASLAAGFGTSAVLAAHALPTVLFGPVANALAVPWTAFWALPGSLLAACVMTLQLSFMGDVPTAQGELFRLIRLLMWPAEGLVEAVSWSAERMPLIPMLSSGSYAVSLMTAVCGLLAIRLGWHRCVVLCWVAACLLAPSPFGELAGVGERPRVWFFDVGQGDAALVQGRRASILIDTGPGPADGSGGRALVRSLRALGQTSLDVLVVSHADLDHRGGAIRVLEQLEVAELWLPEAGRGDPVLQRLATAALFEGTRVSWHSRRRESESLGDLEIETLWPPDDGRVRSRNAGSLVLQIEVDDRSFLFLADVDDAIEAELMRDRPGATRIDYLKVSHHGSGGGTSARFLERLGARHAIVSAPCRASRGLPSPRTMARIRASTSRLWWTGRDGAVAVFVREQEGAGEVRAWAPARNCPTGESLKSD